MKHHLKTVFSHIRRSPYQSIAAIVTMTLTLSVASVFLVTVFVLQVIIGDFEKRPQVTAYFSDIKTEDDIRLLDQKLKDTGKVESTTYVSKQAALEFYQQQFSDDPLLLEMVTADMLPASLEVSAKDPGDLDELAGMLKNETGVEDVVYLQEEVDALVTWTKAIRAEGIMLISLLLLATLLTLLTIISMKIALRRKEIKILNIGQKLLIS